MTDLVAMVRLQLQRSHERVQRCLADLSEEDAQRCPLPRLSPIVWQVGHLALYDGRAVQKAGTVWTGPEAYERLFLAGTGGPAGYPPIWQVRETFDRTHSAILRIAEEADLARPVEGQMYTNVGGMLIFACVHRGYHIGKMTTLRALLDKPVLFGPAMAGAPPRPAAS